MRLKNNQQKLFKSVGHVCMMRREQQNLSIRKMAKQSKTNHQSLSAFERGETNSLYCFLCYINMLSDSDINNIHKLTEDFINDRK